jgi:hypothetical protein
MVATPPQAFLKRAGTFDGMASADIKKHITQFKIIPKRNLFKQRAVDFFVSVR